MKYLMLVVSIGYMILVVAFLAAGYHYRADILPGFFGEEPELTAQAETTQSPSSPAPEVVQPVAPSTSAPAPAPEVEQPVAPSTSAPAPAPEVEQPVAPSTSAPAPAPEVEQPVAPSTSAPVALPAPHARIQPPAPAQGMAPRYPMPARPDMARNNEQASRRQHMPMRPSMPRRPAMPEPTAEQKKTFDLMNKIRTAMMQRNADDAEAAHKELITMYPDNPEYIGQLGNLYFSQKKFKQAAEQYYAACEKLVEAKRYHQAMQMLPTIYRLDAETGEKLKSLLEEKTGRKFFQPPRPPAPPVAQKPAS